MAYTEQQLIAVEQAITRGERVVRYADRTVEYRSVDELMKVRDQIRSSLADAVGPRSRVVRLFHRGRGI